MYSMKEFSKIINLPISTIRYYENIGLLKPKRDHNNYRIFTKNDLKWIKFIIRLKQIGMPIKEIKLYSKLREQGNSTIPARVEMLQQQQKLLKNKMAVLESDFAYLDKKLNLYHELLKNQ